MNEDVSVATVDRVAQRAVAPTAALTGVLTAAWAWYVVAATVTPAWASNSLMLSVCTLRSGDVTASDPSSHDMSRFSAICSIN